MERTERTAEDESVNRVGNIVTGAVVLLRGPELVYELHLTWISHIASGSATTWQWFRYVPQRLRAGGWGGRRSTKDDNFYNNLDAAWHTKQPVPVRLLISTQRNAYNLDGNTHTHTHR